MEGELPLRPKGVIVEQQRGGKPSKGTKADGRLAKNGGGKGKPKGKGK
jgi:hypothetical protein